MTQAMANWLVAGICVIPVAGIILAAIRDNRRFKREIAEINEQHRRRMAEYEAQDAALRLRERERMMDALLEPQYVPRASGLNTANLYARPGRIIPVDGTSDVIITQPPGHRGPPVAMQPEPTPLIPLDELVSDLQTKSRKLYWLTTRNP